MLLIALTVLCVALCALWPRWADLTDARVGRGQPIGPTCRNCRRKPGHLNHAREDVLQRTCEGGTLRAITQMNAVAAQIGDDPRGPDVRATLMDHMDDESLAEMVLPHVDQRRLPWLIGPLVRSFPNNDVAGCMLMFGLPFLFGAIVGPTLLALAIF